MMDSIKKDHYGILIIVGVTFLTSTAVPMSNHKCNGTVNFSIIYEDGLVKNVSVDGITVIDTEANTPTSPLELHFKREESFAGENGIETLDSKGHRIQLVPGGRSGSRIVELFNYTTKTWSTPIDVYCLPLGVAYRQSRDEIVGFCAVNTTYGPITCLPYFKLTMQNGQYVDVSRSGSCSLSLSTANITNPVILQSNTDFEYDEVRLYFAERGTNKLHELSLSQGHPLDEYEIDSDETEALKIDHLVQDSSTSLRVVCNVDNSTNLYHKSFIWQTDSTQEQETGFIDGVVITESIAFDSYNLDYLVTFTSNRKTIIVIKKDGHQSAQQYSLLFTLDNPIHCQNLVEPNTHYLICLKEDGHHSLLINITDSTVTNQTIISSDESHKILEIGILTSNTFYVLNNQQEFSIYLLPATLIRLKTYTVRPNIDFVIAAASNDISYCAGVETVNTTTMVSTTDKPRSHVVIVIVVPIIAIIIIIVIIAVICIIIIKKRPAVSNHVNNKRVIEKTDNIKPQQNNDTIPLKDISCDANNQNDGTHMSYIATVENRDTGERNIDDDPPTNSIDAYQEVGNYHPDNSIMVNSNLNGFPNPADPTRLQDESELTNAVPVSEECIEPQECAEDMLPPRDDYIPIGEDASNPN